MRGYFVLVQQCRATLQCTLASANCKSREASLCRADAGEWLESLRDVNKINRAGRDSRTYKSHIHHVHPVQDFVHGLEGRIFSYHDIVVQQSIKHLKVVFPGRCRQNATGNNTALLAFISREPGLAVVPLVACTIVGRSTDSD